MPGHAGGKPWLDTSPYQFCSSIVGLRPPKLRTGGQPGKGGDAGVFVSTVPALANKAQRQPGKGTVTPGDVKYTSKCVDYSTQMRLEATIRKLRSQRMMGWQIAVKQLEAQLAEVKRTGKGATKPPRVYAYKAPEPRSANGAVAAPQIVAQEPGQWVHPEFFRLQINRLQDLHRAGRVSAARDLAKAMLVWAPYVFAAEPQAQAAINGHRAKLYSVAEQLANGWISLAIRPAGCHC